MNFEKKNNFVFAPFFVFLKENFVFKTKEWCFKYFHTINSFETPFFLFLKVHKILKLFLSKIAINFEISKSKTEI
jgi:hypothetical protein